METPIRGADTARRALAVLEVVCRAPGPVPLDTVVDETDLNRSTVYRLLRAMTDELFLHRAPGGGFVPGSRLIAMASSVVPQAEAYSAARPRLRALAEAAGETVSLHQRVGMRTVVMLGVETHQPLRRGIQVGESTPLFRGAAGLVIVAGLGDADLKDVLEFAAAEGEDVEGIEQQLDLIRSRGFATSSGANHPGIAGIAVGLPSRSRRVAVSAAVTGPDHRWTQEAMEEFAPRLLAEAASLGALFDSGLST